MNKSDLIDVLADATGLHQKTAKKGLEAVLAAIVSEVAKDGRVEVTGFGSFSSVRRDGYTGRNPQTGEPLPIPARTVPAFKPGKDFKDTVNAGQAVAQ